MNSQTILSSLIIATGENLHPIQKLLGSPLMMVVIIMGMMYLLWIRPEQKRAKEHRELIQRIKAGDKIVTTAGLHGVVRSVSDKTLVVEFAKGVEIEMERAAVSRVEKDPAADK
ncbi:MAG: preprotein translocase subunit YajC [Lentisphaeria bacterium]|nr:preprotein translocase subunit YajC [Lentisphaeria bacterium]